MSAHQGGVISPLLATSVCTLHEQKGESLRSGEHKKLTLYKCKGTIQEIAVKWLKSVYKSNQKLFAYWILFHSYIIVIQRQELYDGRLSRTVL